MGSFENVFVVVVDDGVAAADLVETGPSPAVVVEEVDTEGVPLLSSFFLKTLPNIIIVVLFTIE
jgi:hypothetical protein